MKNVIVTGANKGIGLAAVRAILEQHSDAHVLLGSRDTERGQTALENLCRINPDWARRLSLLPIDVTSDDSVRAASDSVKSEINTPLYGLVNNAGIGLGSTDLREVLEVNTFGVKRVCDAFLPLLADGGRVVNVSSASAVHFVSQCNADRQVFFQSEAVEWPAIESLIAEAIAVQRAPRGNNDLGMDVDNAYGFSKACTTLYTLSLARRNPHLLINACTPGYIETDLTRPSAERQGVTPAELGMKSPEHGTLSIMHLLFGEPHGSGHYYGSDAKRSPLDRYRAPGTPEFCPEGRGQARH